MVVGKIVMMMGGSTLGPELVPACFSMMQSAGIKRLIYHPLPLGYMLVRYQTEIIIHVISYSHNCPFS